MPSEITQAREALTLAIGLADRDVIRIRPSDREEFIAALAKWHTALATLASLPGRTGEPVAGKWSFDDAAIGWLPQGANVIDQQTICRPRGLTREEWYVHAKRVCSVLATPPDAEQARQRERVAELEREVSELNALLAMGANGRTLAAEARLAQAERATAVTVNEVFAKDRTARSFNKVINGIQDVVDGETEFMTVKESRRVIAEIRADIEAALRRTATGV